MSVVRGAHLLGGGDGRGQGRRSSVLSSAFDCLVCHDMVCRGVVYYGHHCSSPLHLAVAQLSITTEREGQLFILHQDGVFGGPHIAYL